MLRQAVEINGEDWLIIPGREIMKTAEVFKACETCGDTMKGHFNSFTYDFLYFCDRCDEKRRTDDEAAKKVVDEELMLKRQNYVESNIETIMASRGVPKRYLSAKLSDFGRVKIDASKGLYLFGSRGTGKTHLACGIIRQEITYNFMAEEDERPYFVSIPDLLLQIRDSFSEKRRERDFRDTTPGTEKEIIEFYSRVPLLVLDDLGIEKTSDWSIQTLYTIIDKRYREVKRTIVTSNLSLDDIANKLDDRISSRIAGMCDAHELKGKDRRIQK